MPPSEEAPPSEPLTELNAPLTINLNQLQLTSTKVNVDGMAIDLEKFKTGIHWQQKALTLAPTDVINLAINLPVSEEPQSDEPVTEVPVGEEKSIGETLKELFAKPLLAELPEVILPVDLNVEGSTVRIYS